MYLFHRPFSAFTAYVNNFSFNCYPPMGTRLEILELPIDTGNYKAVKIYYSESDKPKVILIHKKDFSDMVKYRMLKSL